jgi:hypothetical protein
VDGYYHPKAKGEYMDRNPPSRCKLCGGGRALNIACHYHPSILDDSGVPNPKNQTNDSREDMDMNCIRVMNKKDWKMVEAPILEDQMKQPKPKKELQEVIKHDDTYQWIKG